MAENVIYKLSKRFALRIIKLYSFLNDEKREYVISKQLYRSGTSIGANIAESIYAQSDADYVHKLKISLKEASESKYWLELLYDSGILSQSKGPRLNTILSKQNFEKLKKIGRRTNN